MDETGVSCPLKLFLIQRVGQGNQVVTIHALWQMVRKRRSVVSTMRQSHTHIAILYLSLLSIVYMRESALHCIVGFLLGGFVVPPTTPCEMF